MKNKAEKKGFFDLSRFTDILKGNKESTNTGSCCGGFELETIPEEGESGKDSKPSIIGITKVKQGSCCGNLELEEIPDENESGKDKPA